MAAPIEIGIASETKAFAKGIDSGVINPLKDADKELTKLGRAGDKAGDELDDAMRNAQRATERTKDQIEDLARETEQASDRARRMDSGFKEGMSGAGEATAEFKDEAMANLSETVSSFRGDAEDIAQIAQDTLGGVIGNLGPMGMIAGTAGAAGIGLIMGAIEQAKEEEAEFRAQVGELADALIEAGKGGALGIDQIAGRLRELATETEEGAMSLTTLRKDARGAVTSYKDLAQAMAGNVEGIDKIIAAQEKQVKGERDLNRAVGGRTRIAEMNNEADAHQRIVDKLKDTRDAVQEAADAERAWNEAGGPALEARAEQIDALQGELDGAIGSWSDYYNAETGATNPEKYIAAMQERINATSNFSTNVAALAEATGLSFEEAQAVLDQGVDFAPMLQAIMNGGPELQEKFATQVKAAVGGGQDIVNGTPLSATVKADADTDTAEGKLASTTGQERTATIGAKSDTGKADADLTKVASAKRTAVITAQAKTGDANRALGNVARARVAPVTARAYIGAAEAALNSFINRQRTIVVTVDARDREGKPVK